jgi:hypothetical protein
MQLFAKLNIFITKQSDRVLKTGPLLPSGIPFTGRGKFEVKNEALSLDIQGFC